MIEDLIQFYIKELGSWNLVIKYNKKWFSIFVMATIITLISILFISLDYGVVFCAVAISLFFLVGIVMNSSFKRTLKKKYKLRQKGVFWGGREYHDYKKHKIEEYLENSKIKNQVKIDKMIKLIEKKIENTKITIFFIPTVFVGLFYPVWTQFLSAYFRNISVEIEQLKVLASFTFGIVFITFMMSIWKGSIVDILSIKRNRLKDLVEQLESIVIELPESDK
jgi:hypothetical protein